MANITILKDHGFTAVHNGCERTLICTAGTVIKNVRLDKETELYVDVTFPRGGTIYDMWKTLISIER